MSEDEHTSTDEPTEVFEEPNFGNLERLIAAAGDIVRLEQRSILTHDSKSIPVVCSLGDLRKARLGEKVKGSCLVVKSQVDAEESAQTLPFVSKVAVEASKSKDKGS